GPVPYPLPGHEDRHLQVEREDHLFERAGVMMPEQVVDESAVFAHRLRAFTVGDPGRLHYAGVAAEVIDEANEAVIENGDGLIDEGIGCWDGDARHARWYPTRRAGTNAALWHQR